MDIHDKGDVARVSGEFRNLAGALADPTTIALEVRKPSGTQVTYTYAGAQVVKDSVGVYHYDLALDQAGRWTVRWITSGDVVAAELAKFWVRSNPLTGTDP